MLLRPLTQPLPLALQLRGCLSLEALAGLNAQGQHRAGLPDRGGRPGSATISLRGNTGRPGGL